MNKLPSTAKGIGKTMLNMVKACGPLLVSQSETLSKEFAKHKGRLASIEVMKEVIINEAKILQSTKEELLKRYIDSDPVERIRIKRDIKEIDESYRTLNIEQQSIKYLSNTDDSEQHEIECGDEVSYSWLDRFNELAKLRHEPWREDLLARALAKELESPGSVSPRVLWLIGTLEEDLFNAFSLLLDIASTIGSSLMIPSGKKNAVTYIVPKCYLGENIIVGQLIFMLQDVGLVADITTTTRRIDKGGVVTTRYRDEEVLIKNEEFDIMVQGVIFSKLGSSIASFYETKENDLGRKIFHDWVDSLDKNRYELIQKAAGA